MPEPILQNNLMNLGGAPAGGQAPGVKQVSVGDKKKGFWQKLGEGLRDTFAGRPEQLYQFENFDPQQMQSLVQLLSQGMQGIQNFRSNFQMPGELPSHFQAGSISDFEPIRAREVHAFNTQTIPSLAERFTAMGGGQRSSAFQGALGAASSNLHRDLAALAAQYGLQREQQAANYDIASGAHNIARQGLGLNNEQTQFSNFYNMLNQGLRPRYDTNYVPRNAGLIESGINAGSKALPSLIRTAAMG